jgi:hypothetical protein
MLRMDQAEDPYTSPTQEWLNETKQVQKSLKQTCFGTSRACTWNRHESAHPELAHETGMF